MSNTKEIPAFVEANHERARAEEAAADWHRHEELRLRAAYRRADAGLALRMGVLLAVVFGLIAAVEAGLMASVLAGVIALLGISIFCFYAGAWWQYRFGKEGVLRGTK